MAKRDSQRICPIFRQPAPDFQQCLRHVLDLLFGRGTGANHGLFDRSGGVFVNRYSADHAGGYSGTPCLPQL